MSPSGLALAILAQEASPYNAKWEDLLNRMARGLASEAKEEIPPLPKGKLLVAPLSGDPGFVAETLRTELTDGVRFVAPEKSKLQEWLELIKKPKPETAASFKEALDVGKGADADYVLFGKVRIDAMYELPIDLTVHFRIVSVKEKQGVFIGSYQAHEEKSLLSAAQWKQKVRSWSSVWRIVIWAILMLVLPFIVLAFKEAAAGSRPLMPVMMVVAFTGLDVFLAFAFLGFDIDTVFAAGVFVAAMVLSLFWNLFVLSKISQMSSSNGT